MFPNLIKIKISNTEQEPLSNIAILIKIFAKHKNDYYLIPNTSNEYGIIEVSQKWIRESIEKDRNLFIMDYASNLDDCHSEIKINVMNKGDIERTIETRSFFKEEYLDLTKTANHNYFPVSCLIEMEDQEEQIIDIVLRTISTTNLN